jgi:hypothetical protein
MPYELRSKPAAGQAPIRERLRAVRAEREQLDREAQAYRDRDPFLALQLQQEELALSLARALHPFAPPPKRRPPAPRLRRSPCRALKRQPSRHHARSRRSSGERHQRQRPRAIPMPSRRPAPAVAAALRRLGISA